jgi:hypothetical protein
MSKTKDQKDGMKVAGFFRVQLTEAGKGVVGDSGWCKNQVTNDGIRHYLVDAMCSGGGNQVGFLALGTGGAPASTDTVLAGEVVKRQAVSSSIIASATAQFTGAFASANSFVTATVNISNIGLFDLSSAGTMFSGNTFASSSCATNQSVNCTYQIRFASA